MKPCISCGQRLELESFYKHPKMLDGHLNKCKICVKDYQKKYRKANPEKLATYEKTRTMTEKRVLLTKEMVRKNRKEFPDRYTARNKVAYAVKTGTLVPQPCWECGKAAEAHHPDYSRPLDVVWLCPLHHKQTHALVHNPY